MERSNVKLDELRKWKEKFETEHKMWKSELKTEQTKLIRDLQLQCLSNREPKAGGDAPNNLSHSLRSAMV